ncbi:MAG: CBS domain-containing protein [Proteobacteria bacterium]|nr:CBS domain-containing protein [Pseudomonadota bacterium]
MTTKVEWINPDLTVREAARRMKENEVGCLPVGEHDRLVGMITDRDIVCRAVAEGTDPAKAKARDVMSKGITWCFDDQNIEEAIHLMDEKHIHHLPVLSRQKRMVGILSLSDLAQRNTQGLSGEFFHALSRDSTKHATAAGKGAH